MDTLKFALALEAADMNPEQAAIIASEFFAIYRHAVLGGAYVPVDYGDFDVLSAKAKAVRDKKEAMNNELRGCSQNNGENRNECSAKAEKPRTVKLDQELARPDTLHDDMRQVKARLSAVERQVQTLTESPRPVEDHRQARGSALQRLPDLGKSTDWCTHRAAAARTGCRCYQPAPLQLREARSCSA